MSILKSVSQKARGLPLREAVLRLGRMKHMVSCLVETSTLPQFGYIKAYTTKAASYFYFSLSAFLWMFTSIFNATSEYIIIYVSLSPNLKEGIDFSVTNECLPGVSMQFSSISTLRPSFSAKAVWFAYDFCGFCALFWPIWSLISPWPFKAH